MVRNQRPIKDFFEFFDLKAFAFVFPKVWKGMVGALVFVGSDIFNFLVLFENTFRTRRREQQNITPNYIFSDSRVRFLRGMKQMFLK